MRSHRATKPLILAFLHFICATSFVPSLQKKKINRKKYKQKTEMKEKRAKKVLRKRRSHNIMATMETI